MAKKSFFDKVKKEKQKQKNNAKVAKTAQQTIPYIGVYANGVIETSVGRFSKSYLLEDVNFKIATPEEQANIFLRYQELLNMFGPEVDAQITVFNRDVDAERVKQEILMPLRGDHLDVYREEQNQIISDKMNEGKNNLAHEKYLTVSIEAEGIDAANIVFSRLDVEIPAAVKLINGVDTVSLTIGERLSILYDIYNMNTKTPFYQKAQIGENIAETFNLSHLKKLGISTKDLISPSCITVENKYLQLDDKYARVLFLEGYPSFLSTDFFTELTSISCNALTSLYIKSLRQDKALGLIKNQMTNIRANVIDAQKKAYRGGYGTDMISPELQRVENESRKLMQDLTGRNQKMFLTCLTMTLFADSLEELDNITDMAIAIGSKHLCGLKIMHYQQETGFASCLPLAENRVVVDRLLTTETAALFIPFATQELSQNKGLYYGLNAVSHNLILFNRKESKNANGIVLGTSGSGKSFSCKREIFNVLLSTDDEVYIIDPEREYAPLAELLGGEVIKIAAGSKTYLNPFDMDLRYADDDNDPLVLKSDYISSLCESVLGGRFGLSPIQMTVIDRCVSKVYEPYMDYLALSTEKKLFDRDHCPTLVDFYNCLLEQPEPEAQNIALALERYATGNLSTFAHKTNVNTTKRFIVYDIKDIGTQLKEIGLQVCLNDIWNKTIANASRNKRTWFYIDEFYLLTQTDSSASFLQKVFKRARKWGGIPTGITQNVEDLLGRPEARGIINNCDFIMMLNQSPVDRIELGNLLGISQTQMSYITNADVGQGLLYTGSSIVPFIDKYPKDTKSYEVMSTKFEDILEFKEEE